VNYVPAAKLVGIFGIRGELKCEPIVAGSTPFETGNEYALDAAGRTLVRCRSIRPHQNRLLIAFEGIDDPDAARALAGKTLYAPSETQSLAEGEYFDRDLIGAQLVDENDRLLGDVVGVEHMPAHDCLVVGPKRALVPMVAAFIRSIDVGRKRIVVADLPLGLIEGKPL